MEQVNASTLELLRWLSARPRSYAETIEAWGSHCPRLTTWEDALAAGLIRVVARDVILTASGTSVLAAAAEASETQAARV